MTNAVAQNTLEELFSTWTDVDKKEKKPAEYLDFNTSPLAIVIALQEAGEEDYAIHSILRQLAKKLYTNAIDVNVDHCRQADEIYSYFSKKHTIRRIKGEWISEYMQALDELVDSPCRVNNEHIGILVSLPRIYNQNRSLERVMKGRKSVPKSKINKLTCNVEFVEKVYIKSGGQTNAHYFFATPNNYLVRVIVEKGKYGEPAWDMAAKFGALRIESESAYVYRVRGYDFNLLQFDPNKVNISPVN